MASALYCSRSECARRARERSANLKRGAAFGCPSFEAKCVCKPGSVLDGHQSTRAIANALQPPPENGRAGLVFSHGVAPDRVYSAPMLPWDRVRSYRTFPPLPRRFALHSLPLPQTAKLVHSVKAPLPYTAYAVYGVWIIAAVYFCCTCPRVTPGGRYPLSLPCGARTFLTHRLSPYARDHPAHLPDYSTHFFPNSQQIVVILEITGYN